jgi:hypothetical protein
LTLRPDVMDNAGDTTEHRLGLQENLLRAAGKEDELCGFSLRQGSHDWGIQQRGAMRFHGRGKAPEPFGRNRARLDGSCAPAEACSAPVSAVIQTALEASSSVNMLKTNSAPSAASRGVAADLARAPPQLQPRLANDSKQ